MRGWRDCAGLGVDDDDDDCDDGDDGVVMLTKEDNEDNEAMYMDSEYKLGK